MNLRNLSRGLSLPLLCVMLTVWTRAFAESEVEGIRRLEKTYATTFPTPRPTPRPTSFPTVPADYNCSAATFATGDGCNCLCGAPDPDCVEVFSQSADCEEGLFCFEGICSTAGPTESPTSMPTFEVPPEWTCDPDFFGRLDGCHCNCGADDPDCRFEAQDVLFCNNTNEQCIDGQCVLEVEAADNAAGTLLVGRISQIFVVAMAAIVSLN